MKRKKINAITWTILVFSPVPLSYDENEGNVVIVKKTNYKGKQVLTTSNGTVTYELRKNLAENCGWTLDSIVLKADAKGKVTNLYSKLSDVESLDENGLESDVMGYFIPKSGENTISKTSPLRIIPFRGIDEFSGNTQIITNRGMIDINDGRKYYTPEGAEIPIDDKFPTSQAFVYEEIDGGYYVLTVTMELNRIGVKEIKDGKLVAPADREYMSKKLREKAVKDINEVLTMFTRRIKHSTILLKPLIAIGGAYERVIPYFCDAIDYDKEVKKISLDTIKNTIEEYGIGDDTIVAIDDTVEVTGDKEKVLKFSKFPIKAIKSLNERIFVDDDNNWYINEEEKK